MCAMISPAGEGRGEGERIEVVAVANPSKAAGDAKSSPSPFIPLPLGPLGEGNSRRAFTEIFASIARSCVIVLRMVGTTA